MERKKPHCVDQQVFQVLSKCGFVDESGTVHLPVFIKHDERSKTAQKTWEVQDLPRTMLVAEFYDQNLRRDVWEKVINPFFKTRLRNGLPPQNLIGVWQQDIFNAWDQMYKDYLDKKGEDFNNLNNYSEAGRMIRAIFPPGDDRNIDRCK